MTLTQQRRYEILAANLIFLGAIVYTIFSYFTKKGLWDISLSRTVLIATAIATLFTFWQAYYIRKGRRWAKILYIVTTSLGILALVFDYHRVALKTFTSTGATINFVSQYILAVYVIVLLLFSLRKPKPEPLISE